MQALLNAYIQARETYLAAALRRRQDWHDLQFNKLMKDAETALGPHVRGYEDAWHALSIEERVQVPNPYTF